MRYLDVLQTSFGLEAKLVELAGVTALPSTSTSHLPISGSLGQTSNLDFAASLLCRGFFRDFLLSPYDS